LIRLDLPQICHIVSVSLSLLFDEQDSGGFQIFSLAYNSVHDELKMSSAAKSKRVGHTPTLVKVSEEGVTFRSYRDGTLVSLSPETTVDAQKEYGADIIIPLDEVRVGYVGCGDP
jgi:queuine tRNA-ribosyltransferase